MLFLQQGGGLMEAYLETMTHSKLFSGIDAVDLKQMLSCLSAVVRQYEKGEYIFRIGDRVTGVGMLLSGGVHITKEDYWGYTTIISNLGENMLFAESFACSDHPTMEVNVVATQPSRVIFLDVKRVMGICSATCVFHTRLIQNFVTVLANKNLLLTEKMEHISKRSTREKLLSYLSEQSKKAGSVAFDIPFNRQQLADYLSVDRSAMSSELSKLRSEGVIDYERAHFALL